MKKEDFENRNYKRKMFLVYTILKNDFAYLQPNVENNVEVWKNYLEEEYLMIQTMNESDINILKQLGNALSTSLRDLSIYLEQQSIFVIFENLIMKDIDFMNDSDCLSEFDDIEEFILFQEEKLERDKIIVKKILEYKIS